MRSPYADTAAPARSPWRNQKQRIGRTRGGLRPVALPLDVQAKWLREARELEADALAQRSLECAALDRENRRYLSLLELLDRPVVDLDAERRSQSLETDATLSPAASAQLSDQRSDGQPNNRVAYHDRVQGAIHRRSKCFATRRRCGGNGRPLAIEPLISREMRSKLQIHLEDKIRGDIWENEVRSRLARPLSASTFCTREEQLSHPLAALKFAASDEPAAPCSTPTRLPQTSSESSARFPYSVEAHAFTRRIQRWYQAFRFRVGVLAALRRLVIAIRVLRRRAIPAIIEAFRRHRRAAIVIQRRFRLYIGWKERVLRPFVAQQVALWVAQGSRVAHARIVIAKGVTRLFLMRRRREEAAERRARHLQRWSTKTRVCLFVHQVWVVRWLRHERETNVACMWKEMQALEDIERSVHTEYKTILATSFGKRLLKKELAAWRSSTRSSAPLDSERLHNDTNITDTTDGGNDRFLRLKQCFRVFDFDQSGSLDLDEFELLLAYLRGKPPRKPGRQLTEAQRRAMPPRLTTAQARNLFDDLDADGNGRVTYEELKKWWGVRTAARASPPLSSASSSYLSNGLDRLLLQSHGLLFWLLGRKQQLEKKFVKKLMVKRAQDAAKLAYLQDQCARREQDGAKAFRCSQCARRFGLRRDLSEHQPPSGGTCGAGESIVVDTFVLKKWIHEEEFRLLDE